MRTIGNSEGIIITKETLDRLGLKTGDSLEMKMEKGVITLKKADEDLSLQLEAARY
ncbi:AbrB/MazE/SpoVT family DNA-binding domain-containing protein, partial [Rhizobium brockwellii]|uniref:AbrB/MazE/SpoVT family DNA-binding domain-containing protein n=1 Tax=Rhizobium brockwellii TaxID=3019932 RepID=UPI003F97B9C0